MTRKDRTIRARLPKSVQEAFLSGDWDATGQLLAAGAEAEAVAAQHGDGDRQSVGSLEHAEAARQAQRQHGDAENDGPHGPILH